MQHTHTHTHYHQHHHHHLTTTTTTTNNNNNKIIIKQLIDSQKRLKFKIKKEGNKVNGHCV